MYASPPAASAPSFESLHAEEEPEMNHYSNMHAMPPPNREPEIDADILAALPPEERDQILEEQRQMLAQFESSNKKPPAAQDEDFDVAEAMAQFEQMDAQLAADIAMAEELQKKEYGKASNERAMAAQKKKKKAGSQSWYEWMTGKEAAATSSGSSDTKTTTTTSRSSEDRSTSSDYPASSRSRGPRLIAAQTGDETPYMEHNATSDKKQSWWGTTEEESSPLVAVPQFSRQQT